MVRPGDGPMAPTMPPARVRPRGSSRLFSRLWRTHSPARCGSDNSRALRSDSTAIFSRSTAHPNRRQPGTPRRWPGSMTLPFRAVPPGCQSKTVPHSQVMERGVTSDPWSPTTQEGTSAVPLFSTSISVGHEARESRGRKWRIGDDQEHPQCDLSHLRHGGRAN
jgi:hypothetical protein